MRKLRTFPDRVPERVKSKSKPSNSSSADAAIHTGHGPGDKPGRPNRAQHRPPHSSTTSLSLRLGLGGAGRDAKPARNENVACHSSPVRRRNALRPLGPSPGLAFAVDHLDRLIERLHSEPTRGRAQMLPLPDTPGGERRLAIVAVADRDEAGRPPSYPPTRDALPLP